MKKFIKFLAAAMMIGALSACGENPEPTPGPTPTPTPSGEVTVTAADVQVVNPDGDFYGKYAGTQTIKGLSFTLAATAVQPETFTEKVTTIQIKKSEGTITIAGSFTEVTVKVLTSYNEVGVSINNQEDENCPSADTSYHSGNYAVKERTLHFTYETAQTSIVIKNTGKGVRNISSIVLK